MVCFVVVGFFWFGCVGCWWGDVVRLVGLFGLLLGGGVCVVFVWLLGEFGCVGGCFVEDVGWVVVGVFVGVGWCLGWGFWWVVEWFVGVWVLG